LAVASIAFASLAPASLKEGRALHAPRLPFVRAGAFGGGDQRARQRVEIERIGPGGRDELAELLDLAEPSTPGLVASARSSAS
jgi:hypothetical protein